jgi:hypothetical protein
MLCKVNRQLKWSLFEEEDITYNYAYFQRFGKIIYMIIIIFVFVCFAVIFGKITDYIFFESSL